MQIHVFVLCNYTSMQYVTYHHHDTMLSHAHAHTHAYTRTPTHPSWLPTSTYLIWQLAMIYAYLKVLTSIISYLDHELHLITMLTQSYIRQLIHANISCPYNIIMLSCDHIIFVYHLLKIQKYHSLCIMFHVHFQPYTCICWINIIGRYNISLFHANNAHLLIHAFESMLLHQCSHLSQVYYARMIFISTAPVS